MELVPLMTLRAEANPPVHTGNEAGRGRYIADCVGGSFRGPRLSGTLLRSGGDWLLLDALGNGHVDGRLTLRTADGCHIYMQYLGIARANAKVSAALAEGREPAYGDMYYVVQPRFETSDARYAWVNGIVSIAEGRLVPGAAEYSIFEARP
ncbi:MAG: DUF3237 domain-containing protein [Actinomycetales bacterium]|nr:DUF3237 domain-containing protein [Actinomycetales bacterium]